MIRAALPNRAEARRLLLGTLLTAFGTGMTLPFLYIYLHQVRHIESALVGAVVAWMGVTSLCLSGPWGSLMDRVGARHVVLPLMIVGATGAASWWWVHHPWQAFISATLMSVAGSAVFSGYQTLLAGVTEESERQRTFALSFALLNLGIGLGGVVAGFLADVHHPDSFRVLYLVDGASWLMPMLVLVTLPHIGAPVVPDEDAAPHQGYRTVFADRAFRRLFAFALLLMSCGYAQLEIGLPAFATTVGHGSTRLVAWGLAANTVTIVVCQLFMIERLQGRSRSRALALAACVVALSWGFLALAGLRGVFAVVGVVACSIVFAVAETVFSPMLPALTNALAPDELRARYNAAGSLVWGITSIAGPLMAAPLIGHGLGYLWIGIVSLGALGAAAVASSLRHRLTPQQDGLTPEPVPVG